MNEVPENYDTSEAAKEDCHAMYGDTGSAMVGENGQRDDHRRRDKVAELISIKALSACNNCSTIRSRIARLYKTIFVAICSR
jgi:hypothetical protein